MAAISASTSNQIAALKELYGHDSEFMKDLVYKERPLLALIPKDESADGMGGKYLPVPIQYGVPQGAAHTFTNAQAQQTPTQQQSFFVYRVRDYQLVSIDNELMEATRSNAAAFVDEAKYQLDGGFQNASNRIAFELFGDGSGTRGFIGSGALVSGSTYTITLSNLQDIVNFETQMTLVNYTYSGGVISAISGTTAVVQTVDRANGVITVLASAVDTSWATATKALGINGDIVAGTVGTGTALALSGLLAWIPKTAPTSTPFWGVDRSVDSTRLGGLRFDATAYTIEEGVTNALAFASREGAKPDLIVIDFASYSALVNSLGARVQYVQAKHDEVEIAFDGLMFQSAYGKVMVLADKNCPAKTAFALTMSTWKLRTLGKCPHILTYGMEGLEGLRVGNADALEIRIGYYGNLTCSAPGWNMVISLSS